MLRKKLAAICCLVLAFALSMTAVVAFAAEPSYTAGGMETVPAFAQGHEQNMADQVGEVSSSLGAAQGYLTAVINDKDRVLLQQVLQTAPSL